MQAACRGWGLTRMLSNPESTESFATWHILTGALFSAVFGEVESDAIFLLRVGLDVRFWSNREGGVGRCRRGKDSVNPCWSIAVNVASTGTPQITVARFAALPIVPGEIAEMSVAHSLRLVLMRLRPIDVRSRHGRTRSSVSSSETEHGMGGQSRQRRLLRDFSSLLFSGLSRASDHDGAI